MRVWIFSCLRRATFVRINPVIDVCVVHVSERNDEPRRPPSNHDYSRGRDWLVCVIGLVYILCSPAIPLW